MELVNPITNEKTLKDMKEALMMSSYRDYVMFEIGINTGLRVSDLLNLKVKDVRGKLHLYITEKKTKKKKQFYIQHISDVIEKYTKHMNDEDWLFPSRKGDKAISRVQAYNILNKGADMIGIEKIGTHTMRKTFGYWYYKKTRDVAYLMKIFNHSSQDVTLRYIGIEQEEIDNTLKGFRI
ncbi:tyrosine-type recombinase/integrase [Bacillus paranthracis]|uniref:tyrosine-type recombinase/integrase n=1 Tax=Bacillus paranthracis TaxID=2026186 RepID=UPI000778493B|nr:integrase [Bacillus cereus]